MYSVSSQSCKRILSNFENWEGRGPCSTSPVWWELAGFNGTVFAMIPYAHATPIAPFSTAFVPLLFGLIFIAARTEMRPKPSAWAGR